MSRQQLHRETVLAVLALALAVCAGLVCGPGSGSPPAEKDRSASHEKDEKMPNLPQPSYVQAFANARLNSVMGGDLGRLSPSAGPPVELALPDIGSAPDTVEWLLSDGDNLIAVGRMQHWRVRLDRKVIEATTPSANSLFALLGGGNYLHAAPSNLVLRGPDVTGFAADDEEELDDEPDDIVDDDSGDADNEDDEEDVEDSRIMAVPVEGWRSSSVAWTFFMKDADFIIVFQNYAHQRDPNAKEIVALRKRLDDDRTSVKWMHAFDAYGARSPVRSDGSIVLCREDGVRLLDVDGREVGRIDTPLMAGMVSVDFEDTIWGMEQDATGLRLSSFSAQGERLSQTDLPGGEPVQPPVTLPDGRVVVVTLERLLCIRDGKLLWDLPLPARSEAPEWNLGFTGGQDPLVTATADNKILVKQGHRLWIIEEGPEPVLEFEVPGGEVITSNLVVTPDGRLCFACSRKLFCLSAP